MIFFVIIAFLAITVMYIINNKLVIDFNSFIHKGFKKSTSKFGLYLYTGKQGTGKTYSSIRFCQKFVKKGNCVLITNIKSYWETLKSNYNDVYYIYDIFDIINFVNQNEKKFKHEGKQILIFFDEIFTVCEKSGSLTPQILSFLSQLRKRDIIFVSTAQEWSEINITFRRYCRFQISCNMFSLPILNIAILSNLVNDGDGIHWDTDLQDFVAPLIQTNISKGNKSIIDLYDTFETIKLTTSINKRR